LEVYDINYFVLHQAEQVRTFRTTAVVISVKI